MKYDCAIFFLLQTVHKYTLPSNLSKGPKSQSVENSSFIALYLLTPGAPTKPPATRHTENFDGRLRVPLDRIPTGTRFRRCIPKSNHPPLLRKKLQLHHPTFPLPPSSPLHLSDLPSKVHPSPPRKAWRSTINQA